MKTLIYLQDPGGAKYLLPLLSEFLPREGAVVVAHPLAQELCRAEKISFSPLDAPPDEERLRAFLRREGVSRLICTLSAPKDMTNAYLVSAAAAEGLPSLGFMDHWKGFYRIQDKDGSPRFAPDLLGCIDEPSKAGLSKIVPPERIRVIGHPPLERALEAPPRRREGATRVLVISQPDKAWRSVFAADGWRSLKALAAAARAAGAGLAFRPHPKEVPADRPPEGVALDVGSTDDALARADVFVGVDSMLLIEAAVAGKHCLRLSGPDPLPYAVGEELSPDADPGPALARALAAARTGPAEPPAELARVARGSRKRGLSLIEEFVAQGVTVKR